MNLEYDQADREIVLAAVKQDGWSLKFASNGLKADREIVLVAVKQNGDALYYSPKALQNDPLMKSWAELSRPRRNWRKCREAYKGRHALWFWVEETVKRVHKDAPPLEMGCMVGQLEEHTAKRARV